MERRIERAVTGAGPGPGVGGRRRRREWGTTLERDDDDDVRAGRRALLSHHCRFSTSFFRFCSSESVLLFPSALICSIISTSIANRPSPNAHR